MQDGGLERGNQSLEQDMEGIEKELGQFRRGPALRVIRGGGTRKHTQQGT